MYFFIILFMDIIKKVLYEDDRTVIYGLKDNNKEVIKKLYSDKKVINFYKENGEILFEITKHKNLCHYIEYFFENEIHYIKMEKMNGCDLFDYINKKSYSKKFIINIVKNILKALIHLNDNGYIHCDVKSENIRICENNEIKLFDYDLMEKITSTTKIAKGTIGYMAPEMFINEDQKTFYTEYHTNADIWSLGVTLYNCLVKKDYFSNNMEKYIRELDRFNIDDALRNIWKKDCQILLTDMLIKSEKIRPTPKEFYKKHEHILDDGFLSNLLDLIY